MELCSSHPTLKNMLGKDVAIFFVHENISFHSKSISGLLTHFSEISSLSEKFKPSFQVALLSCKTWG